MFKAFIGKLTCGVALLVGFAACGASDEAYDDLAAPSAVDGTEAGEGEASAATQSVAADGADEAVGGDADPSAAVEASGFVLVDCFVSVAACFPVRDAIFAQSGVFCVCQPPDLDQNCGGNLVDLECNL